MLKKQEPNLTLFETTFDQFIYERSEQIMSEQVFYDPEYHRYFEECTQAVNHLYESLNQEQKDHYQKYESPSGMCQAIATRIVYQEGLKDGIKLGRLLGLNEER